MIFYICKMKEKMDIKILVVTHLKYWHHQDNIYIPIQAGAENHPDLGYIFKDNNGDNISIKNPHYSELTAMYWAWKNLHADYIGICHYCRYFAHFTMSNSSRIRRENIFTRNDYEKILSKYDGMIAMKQLKFLSVKKQYAKCHYIKDLYTTREIIKELFPEYMKNFDKVLNSHKMSISNTFVLRKGDYDDLCEWMFTILFKLEERTDISCYSPYQQRLYAFISERLINVWLHHKKLSIKEEYVVVLKRKEDLKYKMKWILNKILFHNVF